MNDTLLGSYGYASAIEVTESGGLCGADPNVSLSDDPAHLMAFGLQVDDSAVVTFSYTIKDESDVANNTNGYICEADGKFGSRHKI